MANVRLGKVAMRYRGTYDSTATYTKLDVVSTSEAVYMYNSDTDGTGIALSDTRWVKMLDNETGPPGQGIPSGGTSGQVIMKNTATDYDTKWITSMTRGLSFHIGEDGGLDAHYDDQV